MLTGPPPKFHGTRDILHGDQHDVAGETDVGFAGVVDEEHHCWLVFLWRQRYEV